MASILIVEDEQSIRTVVRAYLEQAGYRVHEALDGVSGLEQALRIQPDLVILDLNLPAMDGTEVAARLRAASDVYILMLTARSEEIDRIAGLRIGADDYLTKPFSPRELVARVEAILRRRRPGNGVEPVLQVGSLLLEPGKREARVDNRPIDLTTTEYDVLLAMVRHAERVLSREQLIELVWGSNYYGTDRVVDVYVGQVRRKLEALGAEGMIRTLRGVGYRLTAEH
jgi:two-component system alkaline phosphatase synthesis response regulator PhoP